MRNFSLIIILFISCFSLKSQTTCADFKVVVNFNDYTINAITHDTSYVTYIQFNLSDTVGVFKIKHTLSNLSNSSVVQNDYQFNAITVQSDLKIAGNCARNIKTMTISFGYFQYTEKNYTSNIKLYGRSNTLLSNTDFNFLH